MMGTEVEHEGVRARTPARQPAGRPALHREVGATSGGWRYIGRLALHREVGATSGGWRCIGRLALHREVGAASGGWRCRVPRVSVFENRGTAGHLRANSERLRHRRWLFFLFLDGPLGVGEDFSRRATKL